RRGHSGPGGSEHDHRVSVAYVRARRGEGAPLHPDRYAGAARRAPPGHPCRPIERWTDCCSVEPARACRPTLRGGTGSDVGDSADSDGSVAAGGVGAALSARPAARRARAVPPGRSAAVAPAMGAVAYRAHRTLAAALASLRREPRRAADPLPEIVERT